jgi:signal transduction histidine kinase
MDRRIVAANDMFRRLTGPLLTRRARPARRSASPFARARNRTATTWRSRRPRGSASSSGATSSPATRADGRLLLHSIARDVTASASRHRRARRHGRRPNSTAPSKSRLLATVSHELRTPLSGILGMTHLLTETRLTQEQDNYLTGIRQSGHALTQLVEDLLDFSTIEVGRFQLAPARGIAAQAARERGRDAGPPGARKGHRDRLDGILRRSRRHELRPARLRQVLFNVIGNAVKFTQVGGVFIRVLLQDEDLLITVTDTGPA